MRTGVKVFVAGGLTTQAWGAVDVADGTAGDHILGAFVGDTYKLYGPREIP